MKYRHYNKLATCVFITAITFSFSMAIASACDQDAICEHIYYCLYRVHIDDNLRFNIVHSIKANDPASIRSNVYICQEHYATKDGYDHWSHDEHDCYNDALLGMAKLAYSKQCTAKPAPPTPPNLNPGEGNNTEPMHWCFTCATTLPIGSPCECTGQHGTVSRHQ